MKNNRYLFPLLLMLFAIGVLVGMKIDSAVSGDDVFDDVKKFNEVLTLVQKNYVDQVKTDKLTEAAIKAMLEQLDPHSVYITPDQLKRVNEEFQGKFEGIGVEFQVVNDTILIVSPIVGGPSEALGIQAGDRIVMIDGVSAIGITTEDVPKKLRGPKGTKVTVGIHRPGLPNLLEFEITRDVIPLYSVDVSFMINSEVAYVRVTRFSATTNEEFTKALSNLKSNGMKKLVLDLRNNPGGYLDQAFKMASLFIEKGRKIVYTRGRVPEFNAEYVSEGGEYSDIPLVILVNDGSASASEIVSGAVQDWDRGLIVGETTFGKGLVQRQYDLSDGSAIRVTTSRYYTPSGRLIQKPYEGGKYLHSDIPDFLGREERKDTARPDYKTMGGRTVFGGGGITPDYAIKLDTLTEYSVQLRRVNLFLEYGNKYVERAKEVLKSRYGSDYMKFSTDFEVSDEMLKELISLASSRGIEYNEEQFRRDVEFIKTNIAYVIARDLWGNNGAMAVWLTSDKQFQKALELIPEAEKLAHLR